MTFIPAEFFVGKTPVWHVPIAGGEGRDEPPVELENRRSIDGRSRVVYLDPLTMEARGVAPA